MRLDKLYLGARHRNAVEWRAPALDLVALVGLRQRPQLDQPGTGVVERLVRRHAVAIGGDAPVDVGRAERVFDRAQHGRAGAERIGERDRLERETGRRKAAADALPPRIELARRRALEREDRLLLVADREDRALDAVARAVAGRKLRDDVLDDVPLPRAGVLRLVDQDMIDAAVELVMHPAGRNLVQHRQRLVDQIVIVEQAALVLFAAIVRRGRGRDMQQRLGAVAGDDGAAFLDQRT